MREWLDDRPVPTEEETLALADEEEMWEAWDEAQPTIARFNELGGGPYEEEDGALDSLGEAVEVVERGRVGSEARMALMEEVFVEYDALNSGFEDALLDLCFSLCSTREEWEHLVEKLEAHPTDWRREQVMRIYRDHLEDRDAYMGMRTASLETGSDYWDLARYHLGRGEDRRAVEVAEEGITRARGRLDELLEFLWERYEGEGDRVAMDRVVDTAVARRSHAKAMLDRSFEHHAAAGDREEARRRLLQAFEHARDRKYYREWTRLRDFLTPEEIAEVEAGLLERVREGNPGDHLRILLDRGEKATVLRAVLDPPRDRWGFEIKYDRDDLAYALAGDYPEEIASYFWERALPLIPGGTRRSYREAACHLSRVKRIQAGFLGDAEGWERRIAGLREEYPRRTAFLEEVRDL